MINDIKKNEIYKYYSLEVSKKLNINYDEFIDDLFNDIDNFANELNVDINILKIIAMLSYLGAYQKEEDYIKVSAIIAVKILNELKANENTIGMIVMGIAGQGNNGNSVNYLSAIISLITIKYLKTYLKVNNFNSTINLINFSKYNLDFKTKTLKYEFEIKKNNETAIVMDNLLKIINNSVRLLDIKVFEEKIKYVD